ncbi:MAG TPA: serine hydrolase domain-containing protein [Steroidobacteraceae bacterium]|nr:serine hydrolase domain-containing protein [Steroidobacteraceae bacterium]
MSADDVSEFLDRLVPAQLARSGIPGAVVVVVKDDKVLAAKGYGLADVATHRPMTSDRTLANIASIKKLFEGIAIMQLVEQGRLNLDQDVNDYLDFSIPTPKGGVPVTLRRLMTHRGGFEDWFKTTHAPLAQRLPPRLFPYGDVPAYSNYGATLMTYILERVSREPARDYVTDRVLAPLGMRSSSFGYSTPPSRPSGPTDNRPLMATGYQVRRGAPPVPLDVATTDLQLNATGDDMGRFIRAILDGGVLDGQRILRTETLATMMAPQVAEPLSVMGLNFYQREVGSVFFIGHRGDTSTFQDDLILLPRQGFGLYVAYTAQADDNQRDELEQALVERYFVAPAMARAPFAARSADAAAVAGWYEHTRRSETNMFSVEELFTQRRIKGNADGSITAGVAGVLAGPQTWTKRREIAPFVFEDPTGDRWAFETKRGGLEILETTDGTSGRERVTWYKVADFVQPLMSLSLAIMAAALLVWPGSAILRRIGVLRGPNGPRLNRRLLFVHAALLLHLAAAAALIFLIVADWDKRQIFVDALDPWLVAIYVDAWLAVLATPIVAWIAYRTWRQAGAGALTRSYFTVVAAAMLVSAWFALVWHVAGTTVKY